MMRSGVEPEYLLKLDPYKHTILILCLRLCSDRTNWYMYFGYCHGVGIIYITRNRSQTVVRGRLATARCRRRRLPPLRVVASCGGRNKQGVGRLFLSNEDVFSICDKAALL